MFAERRTYQMVVQLTKGNACNEEVLAWKLNAADKGGRTFETDRMIIIRFFIFQNMIYIFAQNVMDK